MLFLKQVRNLGSSPHARGALVADAEDDTQARIIPACAGSTLTQRRTDAITEDHPRMRGEHRQQMSVETQASGSSPHARGAPHRPRARCGQVGIIPACAGSTLSPDRCGRCARDHPRMRGEHAGSSRRDITGSGSSPHARGAHSGAGSGSVEIGIIPACAGSTAVFDHRAILGWDHPRMRGEHGLPLVRAPTPAGSSPHARGARYGSQADHQADGIIPACAGSTAHGFDGVPVERDHPRMRGEHPNGCHEHKLNLGSSPHARGARLTRGSEFASERIIPACAGSTLRIDRSRTRTRDHPRMRGEHNLTQYPNFMNEGSSPHARGARDGLWISRAIIGIIPACAGSTFTAELVLEPVGDHPRMRGEHEFLLRVSQVFLGSSPHARGARLLC